MNLFAWFAWVFLIVLILVVTLVPPAAAHEVTVHYHRPDADYDGWTLWTWNPDAGVPKEISQSGRDDYGVIFRMNTEDYNSPTRIGTLPKLRNWDAKDDPDRFWTPSHGNDVYVLSADKTLHTVVPDVRPRVLRAYLDAPDRIRIVLSKKDSGEGAVKVEGPSGAIRVQSVLPTYGPTNVIEAILDQPIENYAGIKVSYAEFLPGPLVAGKIVDSYFDGRPLGALYRESATVFRTFAPTATNLQVRLYDLPQGGESRAVSMKKNENGVWSATVEENLRGRYYTYLSEGPEGDFEIIDPYSRSNTAHNGRGMITHDVTPIHPAPSFPANDAVIYEVHIRDLTIDPNGNIAMKGKYLGLSETGTMYENFSTGIDHLKELGVNVIQIMPFQDFDNNEESDNYNWGYMPFHFFSPDGWYATRRDDATRVKEVKKMIDVLHREGFKVVLDVVNNHTAEGNPEMRVSFNGLAPNYYYRLKDDGTYSNGSGCGNEFRSESPMGRKFIVDSLLYWVDEYDIDGFRFDLMGLIDLETMKTVVTQLRALKPEVLVYGEPWAAGPSLLHKGSQKGLGFGVFNDHFRDALKGSTFGKDPGFIQAGREIMKVKRGIMGSINDFTLHPTETINYVEAHDNHTLWDRLAIISPDATREDRIAMNKLAAAVLLTSQGIPFLHGAQDILRTKNGHENSYNSPDEVNMIHWRWKKENFDVFKYYQGLIALRKAHPMFRMSTGDEVRASLSFLDDHMGMPVPSGGIGYVLSRGTTNDSWEKVLVLFNSNSTSTEFTIPPSDWIPVVSKDAAGVAPLGAALTTTTVTVAPRSATIFYSTIP